MKEDKLLSLVIEVTRYCNFSCGHCLRGESEKNNFKPEYLKKFLKEKNIKYIPSLTLSGGEPFSKVKTLNSILNMLKKEKIMVGNYYIATNGSMFTKGAFKFIAELHSYCDDNDISHIEISNSLWHKEEREKLGLSTYLPDSMDELIFDFDNMNKIKDINFDFSTVRLSIDSRKYQEDKMIAEGRRTRGIKATDSEGLVFINSNGKVLDKCDLSYKNQDL